MQILGLLGPAALVALASAQFDDEKHLNFQAREEAPGYDDLRIFI